MNDVVCTIGLSHTGQIKKAVYIRQDTPACDLPKTVIGEICLLTKSEQVSDRKKTVQASQGRVACLLLEQFIVEQTALVHRKS